MSNRATPAMLLVFFSSVASVPAFSQQRQGHPATLDTTLHSVNTAAQPIGTALKALAAQTGLQVLVFSQDAGNTHSPAVNGTLTTDEALARILNDSDLTYEKIDDHTVAIRKKEVSPGSKAHLRVAQTEVSESPPTPAAADSGASNISQGAAVEDLLPQEVVVTGTRIRGAASVGSVLMTMDKETMEESGLTSTMDMMSTNPAIILGGGPRTTGGANPGGGGGQYNTVNIHGLGSQATLHLVNGHRTWGQGQTGYAFDPNNIPGQMLQRTEVVPDGASPIYGADAVAGTVNYILRNPANVAEFYVGQNWMKGLHDWTATAILGRAWNAGEEHSGGIILSYQRKKTGGLSAATYPSLYNNDYAPYGGSPSTDFAAPGNIVIGTTSYAIPHGQDGQNLTLSQLGAPGSVNRQNIWGGDPAPQVIPPDDGYSVVVNYNQRINDWLEFFGDSMHARDTSSAWVTNSSVNVTAKVPNSNPYSPCNPSHYAGGVVTGPADLLAACATGFLTVHTNDVAQIGQGRTSTLSKGWATSDGFHIKLPGNWQITPQMSMSQYLNWNSQLSLGLPTPDTFNYFCDPVSHDCSQPGAIPVTVPPYQGTPLAGPNMFKGRFQQLQGDGPLFALPGGTARLAVGIEHNLWNMSTHTSTQLNARRKSNAVFSEIYIPIVGRGNAVTGINSLELNLAGRLEDFSDTGKTTNPKIGINWAPIPSLKFHGSYGTSFHPAYLATLDDIYPTWRASTLPASAIDPALCPRCTDPTLYGAYGATKLTYSQAHGHLELLPETSKSYSLGFDWAPESIPGLVAGVNGWWIKYINQVGNAQSRVGPVAAVNTQLFNEHIIYNPTFFTPELVQGNALAYYVRTPLADLSDPNCAAVDNKHITTQELFNTYLKCSMNNHNGQNIAGATSTDPDDVLFYTYHGQMNAGSTLATGFDLYANFAWQNDWGNWKTNFIGEYIPRFDIAIVPGAPVINEAGKYGYALKFKGRLQLNHQRDFGFGSVSSSLFINYNSPYTEELAYLPVGASTSYADINSRTTLDLAIVYKSGTALSSFIGDNITFSFSAQNVLNKRPPTVLNNIIQFDPSYGWPPGRVMQLQIGKSFQ